MSLAYLFSYVSGTPKYIGVKENLNYSEAQEYCRKNFRGGLFSFENETVYGDIQKLVTTLEYKSKSNNNYWTALKYNTSTKSYKFIDGADATFANTMLNDSGQCIALNGSGGAGGDNCFSAFNCSERNYFICSMSNITQGI